MILTCDVSTSAGLDRFRKQFPENYIDLGIAEQNLIGVATGLASEKFKVITTTFAPFQAIRCCEQIKVNLGYMKEKITMVGLASGLILGNLGFTNELTFITSENFKKLEFLGEEMEKILGDDDDYD